MNEQNKINSLHKRLVKDSILKYSNKVLFERREKNYNSGQNSKRKIKKFYYTTTNLFRKKNNKSKEELLLPFYKTMTSFYKSENSYNIATLIDYFEKNIMSKKKSKGQKGNNIICHTDRNCRNKNLFMTEISTLMSKNIKNTKKIIKAKANKKDDKKEPNIDTLLLIESERNQDKENNNNNDNLKIENYLNKGKPYYNSYSCNNTEQNNYFMDKTSTEYSNYVFSIKISKYQKNQSHKDILSKVNEQKIFSHTYKAKTERLKRLEEAHKNQVEFYINSINSFKKSKKLLENDFTNKIGDYARFISTKKEREKIKQSSLRQKIMDYRKDIEQIKAKINKIEIEKKNIIKWIFLQIKMKEKILKLPEYYITILTQYDKYQSSSRSLIKHEEKNDSFSSFSDRKKSNKKNILKLKEYNIMNSKIFNTNGNNEKYIKPEEYKRILKYKTNLIYKTPEEFKDRLISLEKGNLLLLQYKDMINSQLFKLKKELENLIKNNNKFTAEKKKIGEWEREINIIKFMADENVKIVSILRKKKLNNSKNNVDKNADNNRKLKLKDNNYINDTEKFKYKDISLYESIYIIYEHCLKIGNKSKFTEEIINLVNRKINTKEKEMLLMLEFIELTVDYLIMSINKKKNQNNEIKDFVKEIKSDIEKKHKIEKAKLQKLLDLKKIKSFQENADKRYNKIYFLPKRKISLIEFRNKKENKISKKEVNKDSKIEDYLYNEENSKEV